MSDLANKIKIGQRVMFKKDYTAAENSDLVIPKGSLGTIVSQATPCVLVKLDQEISQLIEYDNCVSFDLQNFRPEGQRTPEFKALWDMFDCMDTHMKPVQQVQINLLMTPNELDALIRVMKISKSELNRNHGVDLRSVFESIYSQLKDIHAKETL